MLIPVLLTVMLAHPGGLAGDGCHYCRTNCSSWGYTYGARHCHRPQYVRPVPTQKPTPVPTLKPFPKSVYIPEKEKNYDWLWLIGAGGLLYYLSRRIK